MAARRALLDENVEGREERTWSSTSGSDEFIPPKGGSFDGTLSARRRGKTRTDAT
jgi:hypothetical protein